MAKNKIKHFVSVKQLKNFLQYSYNILNKDLILENQVCRVI